MSCPETEVLLGGSTMHLLLLSSAFFRLKQAFADRCVTVRLPVLFQVSPTAVDSHKTTPFLFTRQ